MNPWVPRGLVPALALVMGCALTGCKGKASDTSAPRDFADASIDDLERMLASNEQQLARAGIVVGPPATVGSTDKAGGGEALGIDQPVAPNEPPPSMADDYEAEMREAPDAEPVSAAESTSESRASRRERKDAQRLQAKRCSTICDLASSTCGLEQQICRLANDHQDETRYRDSCERAELDCEVSAEACRDCTE